MEPNYIGLAGEFRVMSELFLRGHNPAKSYLANGADLILENGMRIEVKSCHRYSPPSRYNRKAHYLFSFHGGRRKAQDLTKVDFVICWCIDDELFYIIPAKIITSSAVHITDTSINAKNKYASYLENWKQLKD